MRRRDFGLALIGAVAAPAVLRSARAEANTVRIAKQYGLPYLPLMVMESQKLVEKHAAKAGIGTIAVEWPTLGGPAAFVDGLLSGQLDMGVAAVPSLATLWDKTAGSPQEVRALSSVQSQPYVLVTRNPAVKTLADFKDTDRIAVPSVKISGQALAIQMAAAKQWGMEGYEKIDPLTVSLPHPEALAAMLSGKSEVNSHCAIIPYHYYELAQPGIHLVMKSYDTMGGKHTNGVLQTTKKFRDANPKLSAAIVAAQTEANDFIRAHPRDAAEMYRTLSKDQRDTADALAKMIADDDNDWTTAPAKSMELVAFMHKVGRIKRMPGSWKDLFMPEVHDLAGS